MSSLIHLTLFLVLPLAFAQEEGSKEAGEKIAVVKKGTFMAQLELDGKFVPGRAVEFRFWPKAYSGALKVLEVKEPGAMVLGTGANVAQIRRPAGARKVPIARPNATGFPISVTSRSTLTPAEQDERSASLADCGPRRGCRAALPLPQATAYPGEFP